MTTHPAYTTARPVGDATKRRAESRLFTMAAVDSRLPVTELDIIPTAFPEAFSRHTYGIDGDYLARLTRGAQ